VSAIQTTNASKTVGALFALAGILGIVILAADDLLRAVPVHYYALIVFVIIDFAAAGFVFLKPSKMAFTIAAAWSALRITIQIADVSQGPVLGMGYADFANYLFNPAIASGSNPMGIPAALIDLIMILEVVVILVALRARSAAK
jgi:hypothetical protein